MSFNVSYNFDAVDNFSPTLSKINSKFAKFSSNIKSASEKVSNFGKGMSKAGRNISLKAGAPLTAFGVFAVKSAVDFQRAINMVGADTNATAKQLEMLRKEALKYGSTTMFTATQVAQAEFFLGRAGMKTHQIMSMLPGVLQLATAAQMDMGSAAKTSIQVMKGYGFQAKDLGHINNVLVKAFTTSNTDLTTLGESFKLAGPIMKSAGISFEDATTLISVLGNAGIQATMAGTGMRKVVQSLEVPNKMLSKSMKRLNMVFMDSKTGHLDIIKTMQQLHDHGITTAGALTAFGVRGGNAIAALMESYFGIKKMNKSLYNTGIIAQKIAEAQMKGLPGVVKRLTSAFGNLRIELVDASTPALSKWIGKLTGLINGLNNSSSTFKRWAGYIIGGTIALGPFLMVLGKVIIGLALFGKLGIIASVARGLGLAFAFMWEGLLGPIGLFIALGASLFMLYKRFKIVRTVVKGIGKYLYAVFYPIVLLFKGIMKLGGWIASKFHKGAPAAIVQHNHTAAQSLTPKSVFGGMSPVASGAHYGSKASEVMSTLNIKVEDKNSIISSIKGDSTADHFGMNVGANMAMSRY